MLMGIRLQAHPTEDQKLVLSQWMGCAKSIWNSKCQEDKYLTTYARKYLPVNTYAPIDQGFSRYKDKEISPWLFKCPSQILRNSTVNWYKTYQKFFKGLCGKPRVKKKRDTGSIHLTKELFRFEVCADGVTRLFIGSKTNNIGYLSIKNHQKFKEPKSIYVKKKNGRYAVSLAFDDGEEDLLDRGSYLKLLSGFSREILEEITMGIDRGVVRPVQAGEEVFDFTPGQKKNKRGKGKYLKRLQRRLAKRKKVSRRRDKTKKNISRVHEKIANIRRDFCHQTSRTLVDKKEIKVYVFEDLKTKNMTGSAKGTVKKPGKNVKAKAGLNKAILDKGWHMLEAFTKYKAYKAGKVMFKVPAPYTSQECAVCDHTHPTNRKNSNFLCQNCGNTDNADNNAQKVIKKRAINLILDSGTELSKRGVLLLDTGRGASGKTHKAKVICAHGYEASKKTESAHA